MLKCLNPISDIVGIDYENTSIHERVLLRKEYIDSLKKKLDDFIVAWDYLEFIPSKNSGKRNDGFGKPWWSKKYLVSTCGKIAYVKKNKIIITSGKLKKGYLYYSVNNGIENIHLSLHRAACSTFIPVDLSHPDKMETVNHKNGNKQFNFISNLEWMTWEENCEHAIENGLHNAAIRKVKATYVLDDEHYGEVMYFRSCNIVNNYGLEAVAISEAINYNYNCYGCTWEFVEEIPEETNIPNWYLELLKDKSYISIRTKPVLGTIVEGVLKGLKFVVFGDNELAELNALRQTVYKSCTGKRKSPYLGITWKYITRLESKQYQRGLTKEQKQLLLT